MLKDIRVSFVGPGSMGGALISSLLSRGWVSRDNLDGSDRRENRCLELRESHGLNATTDNAAAIQGSTLWKSKGRLSCFLKVSALNECLGTPGQFKHHQVLSSVACQLLDRLHSSNACQLLDKLYSSNLLPRGPFNGEG